MILRPKRTDPYGEEAKLPRTEYFSQPIFIVGQLKDQWNTRNLGGCLGSVPGDKIVAWLVPEEEFVSMSTPL